MKKFNWQNIWINTRLVLMFAAVIFLFSFTSKRNSERKITKSVVVFLENEDLFVTHETVNKLLIENNSQAQTIRKDKLDLNKLERAIDSHNMIEKSQVFVGIDGVLKAIIKQKTPVARVFDEKGSFYYDYQGNPMPLSDNFTARVPLVSGEINKENRKDLNELFRYIFDDAFLKKNIIGIQILPSGSLKMMNRNFNYEIDFGKTINVEQKFNNYKAFFQKAVVDSSLQHYKKINLKFTQQVVCTK
ncbi:cell division protein FtsQ/DivIB [Flavobacterium sp. GT3R68]|uniref:cell division protein FtsQ/DivIB n=1 Tax=Flavobacterium sp. GT3R68 TaxID=2594437 RepID=UPI000F878CA8|nr:cell division protein FtsQ [Flavobacterium sp. GT3R68]RTY90914.1 cell division protein FtsQ [Flavobacterium sp. GSN2]TRW90477.1 cell division protein FtsQ [Flavobacterium sp. GT3R68]